jgi:hypothetical protein
VTLTELLSRLWPFKSDRAAGLSRALQEVFGVTYEGGDGSSPPDAIVIRGAVYKPLALGALFGWVNAHHGRKDRDWRVVGFSTDSGVDRTIDSVTIEFPNGTQKVLFFDVSDAFRHQGWAE